MAGKDSFGDAVNFLNLLESGNLTVTSQGYPILSIRPVERQVELELQGLVRSGMKLSKLFGGGLMDGAASVLRAEKLAKKLSELGWTLFLNDGGERVASMGFGVSRLTGHVNVNLLKLGKLAELLR